MEYCSGYEFDWFAADEDQHVGLFSSAGLGPAPQAFINAFSDSEYEQLLEFVNELLEIGNCKAPSGDPVGVDYFRRFGNKGLFVYDYQDIHRPIAKRTHSYELQAIPTAPLLFGDSDKQMRKLFGSVIIRGVSFKETLMLDPRTRLECIEPA